MSQNEFRQKPGRSPNPLQKHLEEQFGQIRPQESPPEDLKEEVFDTLDTLLFMADLADLFTVKFSRAEMEFLDLFENESDSFDNP